MNSAVEKLKRLRKRFYGSVVFLLMTLSGCIPDPLDVDVIPVVEPQIVVSSQMVPDQTLLVLLTRTFGALDADENSDAEALLNQISVNDAEVTITGPAGTYTLTALDHGAYGGVFIPFVEGESYELKVNSASLGEVSAVTKVSARVTFKTIEAKLRVNDFDDTVADITHRFKDVAGENFYMITSQEIDRDDIIEDLLNPNAHIRLLKDTNFDGLEYGETFRVPRSRFDVGDSVLVSLSNISPDYYHFMELRLDNRFSFIEYLSEPINYPSNINGGKGFFNLYVPDIRFLVLEQPDN